jgi:2,3-bisphosphoglycerate-independent phosphoglycerate mutase
MNKKPKVLLTILDGWGVNKGNPNDEGNAIELANPVFYKKLLKEYPHSLLEASGEPVGLPYGQIGGSEVGHLNIGAGSLVKQEINIINDEIKSGNFYSNKELQELFEYCKSNNKPLHIMGLLSRGGIHSHIDHCIAILKAAEKFEIKELYLHAILDGRDTNPKSASIFLKQIIEIINNNDWSIASLIGRYYAMDRDLRLERTKLAYELYTKGIGKEEEFWEPALKRQYNREITDEFILPIILNKKGIIKKGDGLFFFNFRADRARQIIKSFTGELNNDLPLGVKLLTMLPYYKEYNKNYMYDVEKPETSLGEFFSNLGYTQLRIAETEKKAHITYFFAGEREGAFNGETRKIFKSPDVRTYDLKPEMSAGKITEELVKSIKSNKYNLIIHNFANGDMVGHTGKLKAAIEAIKYLDKSLEKIYNSLDLNEWIWIITADHGNCDKMKYEDGSPHTAHTLNPVNFIVVSNFKEEIKLNNGALSDIVPTLFGLLEKKGIKLSKPEGFKLKNLLI